MRRWSVFVLIALALLAIQSVLLRPNPVQAVDYRPLEYTYTALAGAQVRCYVLPESNSQPRYSTCLLIK